MSLLPVRPTSRAELRDSGSLVGDRDALRRRIAEDGYVFIRGLLDPGLIRGIGARGLGRLQRAGWTEPGPDPVTARPCGPVRAVAMRDAFADPAYRSVVLDPGLNRLAYTSPLADLMHQIMGAGAVCYPLRLPRVVYPTTFAPHQPGNVIHKDYRSVQDMFTAWVPLGDVPASHGGLAVLPGSQSTARTAPRPLTRLRTGWRTTDYGPGDVIVFHCLTTHAALPHFGDRLRFSAELRWQLADQPAPRRLVIGPGGREIGQVAFGHSSWWRPVAPTLRLFDDGPGDRPVRPVPPSRFVRFAP